VGLREVVAAFGVLLAAGPLLSQPTPTLRVPAFTAYLAPDPNAARLSATRPVRPFTGRGSSLTWYGRLIRRGSITIAAAVRVPPGDSARLRLLTGGLDREIRVVGRDSVQEVVFGTATLADTGYQRFTLAVVDSAPAPSVEIHALLLTGPASIDAHFNSDARRNAASVHLRYPTDTTKSITGFYAEVTAIDDPVSTYYMATGFARGYFGMQVNSPTERRIIFSVWDAASGSTAMDRSTVAAENYTQLVAKGDGVVAEVFGNEGTGGHSHLVYPWKTGTVQRFFVTAAPDGDATTYSGYWFHPERNAWQLIAAFRAAKDGQGLRRLYSFSENFGGSTGHLRRKALFGAQWIRLADGRWQELTEATFSHDATGRAQRLDRFMGLEQGQFFLSHGGFTAGYTAAGALFTRPPSGAPPSIQLPPR
jgi:hypothetical protein